VRSLLLFESRLPSHIDHHRSAFLAPQKSRAGIQEISVADPYVIKAVTALFDMLARSFKADAAPADNSDLVWSTNFSEAIAERGKAREAAAKLRLQEVDQIKQDMLEAAQEALGDSGEGEE
jgi:hypothetical protein